MIFVVVRVTTFLEILEMLGNVAVAKEMPGKNLDQQKLLQCLHVMGS